MPRATNTSQLMAYANQDDEFYTPREMIEKELVHYPKSLFYNKKILCNCDDPDHSEFFKYFADNFDNLKLKRLVGLRYSGSVLPYNDDAKKSDTFKAARYQVPIDSDNPAFKRTLFADKNGKKHGTGRCFLRGDDGGFGAPEGKRQLADCDIVVTNPPFSRWREFIAMLIKSRKKFIVIGNLNAVCYSEIFPLIQNGKMWLGGGPRTKGLFIRPNGSNASAASYWYTNLKHDRKNCEIPLKEKYSAKDYPRYDNYPAIEVSRVKNIPADYNGEMGVPLSYLEKHNPKQFEIVGKIRFPRPGWNRVPDFRVRGRIIAHRLLIRSAGVSADWKECKDLSRSSTFGSAGGFVYVAVIPGDAGWFKIGKTNTTVAERVKRDAFSRKTPKVVMALEVANASIAEKQIHDALVQYRKKGTEFFNPKREYLEQELTRIAQKPIRLWL